MSLPDQHTKQCRKCGEVKPILAYAARQNTCIQCRDAAKAKTIARKEATVYSIELGQHIAEILADTPMHMLVKMAGMPTERVIHKWRLEHPEFAEAYEKARVSRADSRGHEIDVALAELRAGRLDHQTAKVWIDTQFRLAAKEHPQRWGEKTVTDLTVRPGKPLEVDTNAWLERVLGPPRAANVIELRPMRDVTPKSDDEPSEGVA